jgi:hypothetical protein
VSYHFRQISEEDKCAHAIIPSFKGNKKMHDKKKRKSSSTQRVDCMLIRRLNRDLTTKSSSQSFVW